MSEDLHSLSGAYALGSLSDEERDRFEAHLADCVDCRTEVDGFLATSARIGAAAAATPPAELKARVLAAVSETRQLPPPAQETATDDEPSAGGVSKIWRQGMLLAVAAAIVALVAIGITVVVKQGEVTDVRAQADRVSEVIAAPDARLIRGDVAGGGNAAVVVSGERDSAVIVLTGLPVAAPDRTYQLWFIGADGARSAGTIDLHDPERVTRVLNDLGATDAIGLTIEPHGGSRQPTTDPVLALELR